MLELCELISYTMVLRGYHAPFDSLRILTLPSLAAARLAAAVVFELLFPNILEMEIVSENM